MADKQERWEQGKINKRVVHTEDSKFVADFYMEDDAKLAVALHNAALDIGDPMVVAEQSLKMFEVCKYLVDNGWNAGVSEDAKEIVAAITKPKEEGG